MRLINAPFLLFVFFASFGTFAYFNRPYYSSLPLAALFTIGAAKMLTRESHVRGRQRIKFAEAKGCARAKLRPGDKGIKWGGITLPSQAKNQGFFFMGAQGSGKGVSLQLLMHQAFIEDAHALGVVHDYKMELHRFLEVTGVPREDIKLLNPFDKRCSGWDIQADCIDKATAAQIAIGFIPPNEREATPFFRLGATFVFRDVLRFFMYETAAHKARGENFEWGLWDVIAAVQNKEALIQMFGKYPKLSKSIRYVDRPNDDILATLYTHTDLIEPIAGLWRGKELISFRKWRRDPKRAILVLGNDVNREDSVQRLNAVLINQIQKAVQDNSLKPTRDTWFFLDEFHAIHRIHGFESFINTARSYRGNVVIATQDINQVFARYGERNANSIIQGCAHKTFLLCDGQAAEWAEKQIGEEEINKESQGISLDGHGIRRSTNRDKTFTRVVMKEDIARLTGCDDVRGLDAFYLTRHIGDVYHRALPFEEFAHVWPTPQIEPDFEEETDGTKQEIDPITPKELKTFGLTLEQEKEQEETQSHVEPEPARPKRPRFQSAINSN